MLVIISCIPKYFNKVYHGVADVDAENVLTVSQCLFENFDLAILILKMHCGLGWSPKAAQVQNPKLNIIKELVDANQRIQTREVSGRLNLSNSTLHGHFRDLVITSKLDMWFPHVFMR